jgi:Rieske Fe-S protein
MTETSDLQGEHGSRRRVLITGAGAIGVAGLLAACGDDETPQGGDKPSTPTANPGTPTGAPGGNNGGVLAKKSDIPVGGGKYFEDELVVVTQAKAGTFAAFTAMCTHQQCVLTKIENGTINCGCHGSKFAIADGAPRGGPATARLEKRELKIEGDDIKLA